MTLGDGVDSAPAAPILGRVDTLPDRPWFSRAPLRSLLEPLNLAGFVTWGLIAADQITALLRADSPRLPATALVLLAYVVCFALANLAEFAGRRAPARWLAVALLPLALADGLLVTSVSGPILLVIAAAVVSSRVPLRTALLLLLAANVVYYFIFRELWGSSRPLYQTALFAGFQAFSLFVARIAFAAETARDELARVNAQLLATRSLLEAAARDRERLRLSRELHDLAGHRLTALKLNLELARRLPEAQRSDRIDTALQMSDALLEDIRGVVGQLRAHDGLSLRPALQQLADGLPGVRVELDVGDDLAPDVDTAAVILRCAQEALTNAVRHGAARQIRIRVGRQDDGIAVEVRDDGRGRAEVQAGHGLTGMRERVQAAGGRLDYDSRAGAGFTLRAWLPQQA